MTYKIILVYDDRLVLVDNSDKNRFAKGYFADKDMNIIYPEILVATAIKFNPYCNEPDKALASKSFIKEGDKFVDITYNL